MLNRPRVVPQHDAVAHANSSVFDDQHAAFLEQADTLFDGLTSRADSVRSRIASCAVANLVAHARRA